MPVFPNKLKISLNRRLCKLETFTRPKEISQTVGGQFPILIRTVRPKKTTKKTRIVGLMLLGILPDLPLFYQTCPVGPTLLGKTVCSLAIIRVMKNQTGQSCLTLTAPVSKVDPHTVRIKLFIMMVDP